LLLYSSDLLFLNQYYLTNYTVKNDITYKHAVDNVYSRSKIQNLLKLSNN